MKSFCAFISIVCFLIVLPAVRAETKEPPVPVRTVAPEYPDEMHRQGIAGLVTVRCTIDEHGDVIETVVVKCSDPVFEKPATDALLKWKFKPASLDGKAISTKALIPIRFVINS
jgi:periplasmic protein TonB